MQKMAGRSFVVKKGDLCGFVVLRMSSGCVSALFP